MNNKDPRVSVAILIVKNHQLLLGLLTEKWSQNGIQVYGIPGRDIRFGEKIGDTVKRSIQEDVGCRVTSYKIFSVNANYAFENHYIEIGVIAEIEGEPANLTPEDWEKWEWHELSKLPVNLFPSAKNFIDCYTQKVINIEE